MKKTVLVELAGEDTDIKESIELLKEQLEEQDIDVKVRSLKKDFILIRVEDTGEMIKSEVQILGIRATDAISLLEGTKHDLIHKSMVSGELGEREGCSNFLNIKRAVDEMGGAEDID